MGLIKAFNQPSFGNSLFQKPIGQGSLITLTTSSSITANNYDSLRLDGTNYVVPVGKKLTIIRIGRMTNAASGSQFNFGEATAGANNSGSAPSGYTVKFAGGGGGESTTNNIVGYDVSLEFTAGKYPVAQVVGAAGNCYVVGYLENV